MELPWIKRKRERERARPEARAQNTDAENQLLDQALERWETARESKCDAQGRPLHQKWRDLERFYHGQQWTGPRPAHKSQPVLNFTHGLVESLLARLVDSTPEAIMLPKRDPEAVELARMLTQIQRYLVYYNRLEELVDEAGRLALIMGTAIFKTVWDPDALEGIGEVKYTVVHPMNFFADPRAHDVRQLDYCLVSVPKSIEYMVRRWPEKGHLVVPNLDWTHTEPGEGADPSAREESALLHEYWFRDEAGDICVMYYSGHTVLGVIGGVHDGSHEPVYRHNRFPFARFVDYPRPKMFWGAGEVEVIMSLAQLVNSFEAQIIDNTRLMAHAEWLINKRESGLREEDAWIFAGRPGQPIFTVNGGIMKLPGAPIPAHVPVHQERLIQAMEQILGVHDVVQGRRPVGVRAASAIIALQESANFRVRRKAKQLSYALQEMIDQGNWLILEHYTEPRRVRVGGSNLPVTLNVREALTQRVFAMAEAAGLAPAGVALDQLAPEQLDALMQEIKFPEFDVEIKVGPGLPYSAAMLYEMSKEFFQLGVIDQQALLEATNFPNREAIIARMSGQQVMGMGERVGERTFRREGGGIRG